MSSKAANVHPTAMGITTLSLSAWQGVTAKKIRSLTPLFFRTNMRILVGERRDGTKEHIGTSLAAQKNDDADPPRVLSDRCYDRFSFSIIVFS